MKHRSFFIIIFFLTLSISVCSQEKYQIAIVGFYNLENLFDTLNQDFINDEEFTPYGKRNYNGKVYWDKQKHLSKVISEMATDINPDGLAVLGVAEIENRSVLKDLVKTDSLKSRMYKIVHYDSKDARGVDVGLIYQPKYFKVLNSSKLPVDLEQVGGGYTRDILYVHGYLLGEEVHIMVGHWPSRRGGEEATMPRRCEAAKVMKTKSDSIRKENPDANIIVMGDFNDDPNSPSLIKCLEAKNKIEEVDNVSFFNPFYAYYSKGIGTLAYRESWNLFDQILVSKSMIEEGAPLRFNSAHIFSKKYMTTMDGRYKGYPLRTYGGDLYQGGYSDHFPTYIIIKKNIH